MLRKISLGKRGILRKFKKNKSRRGISPIIATLLILGLVTTGVVIGLLQILPFIERSKIESGITSVQSGLIELDNAIHELINGGEGFKRVEIEKPLGLLSLIPDEDNYNFQIKNTTDTLFSYSQIIGKIEFSSPSTYDIIPVGSSKYLNGPDPTSKRDEVVIIDQNNAGNSGFNSMNIINMTRDPGSINIDYFYRPKVIVSQTGANIDIQIQFIKLKSSSSLNESEFLAVENNRNQIGVRYSLNSLTSTIFNGVLTANEIISIEYQNTGPIEQINPNWQSLWNSDLNESSGNIVVKIIIFEIEIVSYV